jgi:parallel beta-helix repeat protein
MKFQATPLVLKNSARRFRQAFLIAALPVLSAPGWAATYYVATTGNDANVGSSLDAPFRTIQKAMTKAVAGDSVLVRGGTYRESVEAGGAGGTAASPIRVSGYNGEVPTIKGSEVVTGWTLHSGNIWKKTGWAINSQQVFVDFDARPSNSLQQIGMPSSYYTSWEYNAPVGTGLSTMKAGSFFYDTAAKNLYVWLPDGSDPNKHVMEVSTKRRLFTMRAPYIYLKGLAFRHTSSSNVTQQSAAVEMSANSLVEACDIQYTDFAGLQMGYMVGGTVARNSVISNNGSSGINASATYGFKVQNVTMNYNNNRNFNTLWHAGGFKAATDAYGTIENSTAAYNNASGIWFDYANAGGQIIIRNNFIHHNGPKEAGIFFEMSNNGLIYNNVLVSNSRRGVYLSAADNTRVYNNTIVATSGRAGIEVAGMPRSGGTLKNNKIYNNIVANGTSQYDVFVLKPDGTSIVGNSFDNNDYYRNGSAIKLTMGSDYSDLASWRNATKLDLNSLSVSPGFSGTSATSATSYSLGSGSGMIGKGMNLGTAVPDDYVKTPRGSVFDIGAFEAVAGTPTPTPTADTTPPAVTLDPLTALLGSDGSFTLTASATDNIAVTDMKLYIDGTEKASAQGGKLAYTWNSPVAGVHALKVTASDAALNTGSATGTVTIQAPTTTEPAPAPTTTDPVPTTTTDTIAPAVKISAPIANAIVGSSVNITGYAVDDKQVTKMSIYVDGVLKASGTGSSIAYAWNTSGLASGSSHSIQIRASDAANNEGRANLGVKKS